MSITTEEIWHKWQEFWCSNLGAQVLASQQTRLAARLNRARGYRALQLSSAAEANFLSFSSLAQQYTWRPSFNLANSPQHLIASPYALPLPDECFDVVVVHQMLELLAQPEKFLAEVARITQPQGEVFLFGLNTPSLWSLNACLPARWRPANLTILHTCAKPKPRQVHTWLADLPLKFMQQERFFFHFAAQNKFNLNGLSKLDAWLSTKNLPCSALYLLHLKKQVPSPLRPSLALKRPGWLGTQPVNLPTRTSLKTEK